MKRLRDHNRHRQWTKHEKQEEPEVKIARSAFRNTQKVGRSLRQRAYKATHGEFSFPSFSKRKALAILLVGFALFLLVGNSTYHPTVEAAFTDYHQVGHTYTPLWKYESHDSTRWNYNSTCISFDDSAVPNKAIEFQYTLGYPRGSLTGQTIDSYSEANQNVFNTLDGNAHNSVLLWGTGQTFNFTTRNYYLTSARFYLNRVGSPIGTLQAELHQVSAWNSLPSSTTPLATSDTRTMEGVPDTGFALYQFNFTGSNSIKLFTGTNYFIALVSFATTGDASNGVNMGMDSSSPTDGGVSGRGDDTSWGSGLGRDSIFYVLGTQSNDLGDNCASASTIISKASINLQSVSGRQLVGIMQWNLTNSLNRGTAWEMFLRTNGTLPTFNENWSSSADERTRLLWRSTAGDTSGTQYNYVPRGPTNSIDDEGVDTIVQTQAWTAAAAATGIEFDMVLNFTGPRNVMYRFAGQTDGINNFYFTETDFQSQLQLGQDYYVGFRAIWDTTIAPAGTSEARLLIGTNEFQSGQFNTPLHIDGVPAMCNDSKNTEGVNCPAPSGGTRVFDVKINPLDPSSWANAIIKGMVWAAGVAFEYLLGFGAFFANLIINGLDAIGQFFGLGTVGTNIRTFFTGIANWFSSVFGVAIGWIVTFVSVIAAGIGFITGFFSGSNGFVAWLVSFFTTLPGIWAVIQSFWTALNTVVIGMNYILVIYYMLGMFQVYKSGWNGFRDWLDMGVSLTVGIVKLGFTIAKESWQIILAVKNLVSGWF